MFSTEPWGDTVVLLADSSGLYTLTSSADAGLLFHQLPDAGGLTKLDCAIEAYSLVENSTSIGWLEFSDAVIVGPKQ